MSVNSRDRQIIGSSARDVVLRIRIAFKTASNSNRDPPKPNVAIRSLPEISPITWKSHEADILSSKPDHRISNNSSAYCWSKGSSGNGRWDCHWRWSRLDRLAGMVAWKWRGHVRLLGYRTQHRHWCQHARVCSRRTMGHTKLGEGEKKVVARLEKNRRGSWKRPQGLSHFHPVCIWHWMLLGHTW